ncbi:8-oxoguanine DNA glycosylase protein [Cryptosporidium andersoni]|uniref:DNA-(apurinic or apyrimidinic site) lyase n=1 Tax=Cryptosporidium andersoni TaxID=117008 RepID=A0A1J4MRX6_9CRYT|nr:8-oxoguanine DNA glycosylase protein [Cryptosporidium andersoni]
MEKVQIPTNIYIPEYISLGITANELRISKCLPTGQSFSWYPIADGTFVGILGHRIFQMKELPNDTLYRCLYTACNNDNSNQYIQIKKRKMSTYEESSTADVSPTNEVKYLKIKDPTDIYISDISNNQVSLIDDNISYYSDFNSINFPVENSTDNNQTQKSCNNYSNFNSVFYCCKSTPQQHIEHYFNLKFNWEKEYKNCHLYSEKSNKRITNYSLSNAYSIWSKNDKSILSCPIGIRVFNIDPVEATFSAIITANNNIPRITSIIERIRISYGTYICSIDNNKLLEEANNLNFYNNKIPNIRHYYSFPTCDEIFRNASIEHLKSHCGTGYRAKSIITSAKIIHNIGEFKYFSYLKSLEYHDAVSELLKLHGVGRKVADFILLSGLGFTQAVPIDTHMLKILKRYNQKFQNTSSLSKLCYEEASRYFREKFKLAPGWAQLVLFSNSVIKK